MAKESHRILITGGVRSGKSRFASRLAEGWPDPLFYLATAEILDEEMRQRVRRHREDRGPRWRTVEEPLYLARVLQNLPENGNVLVDCLTLWVSNLVGYFGPNEEDLHGEIDRFELMLEHFPGRVCMVTNEVGSDIVPEHPLARRYRDLLGTVNQRMAARSAEAYCMVSGYPVRLG